MDAEHLVPNHWYWVRRDDGTLAAYPLHRVRRGRNHRDAVAEFFVGSMVRSWPLGHVVAVADVPSSSRPDKSSR